MSDVMREAVICEPVRTPVGRMGGALRDVPAEKLAETVIRALIERTGIDPGDIDDVVLGSGNPSGEAPAIGRVAALNAGLPVEVPGFQLDRRCASGLQAVLYAAMTVQTGVCRPRHRRRRRVDERGRGFYSTKIRWGATGSITLEDRLSRARETAGGANYPVPGGMIETAENLRREYSISREDQDRFSVRSHERAVAAQDAGRFDDELVPVEVPSRRDPVIVDRDEHPRRDTTLEGLAALRPVMGREDPEATVTAGNASGQNDGAAVCLVTTRERAEELGLRPLAVLRSWALAGVPPRTMGIGPVPATRKALERAGLTLADMDLIELNEAFAAQVLSVTQEWKFTDADFERLNVNGSGISLGHPVGATGARILATLLREMDRRECAATGLSETMCIGGGQGLAAVFERVV